MIHATLTISDKDKHISKLFASEDQKTPRASYILTHKDDNAEFVIRATDITAFRAIQNAIIKQLTIYEKIKKL
ncbi:MAG: hypothetical protein ACMXYF_01930 [Candidatus Woesearchaeota archaeon]